jgi:hypothetical protein
MTTIEIRTVGSDWPEIVATWDPNRCHADDYQTARADALYEALGVSRNDDEYTLAADANGQWALIGPTTAGNRYAVELRGK